MTDTISGPESLLAFVLDVVNEKDAAMLATLLNDQHPGEIAHLIESLPQSARAWVWSELGDDLKGEVLIFVHDEVRAQLLDTLSAQQIISAVQSLETGDLAEIIDELPAAATPDVLDSLDLQDRARLETVLNYPENSAGRLMDTRVISIRIDVSVDVVLRYLRRHTELPHHTDTLLVVDKENHFLGALSLNRLLTAQPERLVGEIMQTDVDRVTVDTPAPDVAALFERHDLISVAVVDDGNKLLGRITVDDIVDVIHAEADQAMLSMAGLDVDDDLFAPVFSSAMRRAVWLGINLVTAFLAAWVIGLFEAALQQIVALAVLMPIVASMGGIAGSQTLTLAIRGLALKQISSANARWLATKEIAVGVINGLIWSVVVALIAFVWFGDWRIGGVIAVAIIINMIVAAISGVVLPLLLDKLKLDPALSGSVILTTVTDVVGFMSFLGLGSLFLL